ncbi:ankyrin [Hypoxylon sp. NC0597]|nr:ankyrin [Hypoxylon sp. NC0597]
MANLDKLPLELLLQIAGYLSIHDTSTLSRLNKTFHWQLFDTVFTRGYEARVAKGEIDIISTTLLPHAFKCDSFNIAKWLSSHKDKLDPRGIRVHLETIPDAPELIAHLANYGINVVSNGSNRKNNPDFARLADILTQHLVCSSRDLDYALSIACKYALCKTTRFLLVHGASPNSLDDRGFSVLHHTVIALSRSRLERSDELNMEDRYKHLRVLVDFNANINLRTSTLQTHTCGHKCWRSLNCASLSQTALHMASSSRFLHLVTFLLDNGADPNLANGDGFRPLYTALAQGHVSIAKLLIERMVGGINPVVNERDGMTALHAACRFAVSDLVHHLLELGADANAADTQGRCPLHEALGQTCSRAEQNLIATLQHLADFGADPDMEVGGGGDSPRQLSENHPFQSVRDMFVISKTRKSRLRPTNPENRTMQNSSLPKAPPKVPATHSPQLRGIWASSHLQDVILGLTVGGSALDQNADKPQIPCQEFPPLNTANNGVHTKTLANTEAKEALHIKEYEEADRGQSLLEDVQDMAAQFWKNFPKQPIPKVEANRDDTNTGDDPARRRRRKKKWAPLKLE